MGGKQGACLPLCQMPSGTQLRPAETHADELFQRRSRELAREQRTGMATRQKGRRQHIYRCPIIRPENRQPRFGGMPCTAVREKKCAASQTGWRNVEPEVDLVEQVDFVVAAALNQAVPKETYESKPPVPAACPCLLPLEHGLLRRSPCRHHHRESDDQGWSAHGQRSDLYIQQRLRAPTLFRFPLLEGSG